MKEDQVRRHLNVMAVMVERAARVAQKDVIGLRPAQDEDGAACAEAVWFEGGYNEHGDECTATIGFDVLALPDDAFEELMRVREEREAEERRQRLEQNSARIRRNELAELDRLRNKYPDL